MTTWAVIFTPEAEQEFNALPMDMRAHGAWLIDLLESGRVLPSMRTWQRLAAATGTRAKVTLEPLTAG